MKKLKFKGKAYNGTDPETNEWLAVLTGEVVTVSDVKAEQLKRDFPKDWQGEQEAINAPEAPAPAPEKAPEASAAAPKKAPKKVSKKAKRK